MENKGSHFSSLEKDVILDLAIKYKFIIENKQTDGVTNKQKAIAWENITKEFNAMNVNTHRTSKQIKTFYENIKRKIKKKQAVEKVEKYKTGGGPEQTTTILLPGEEKLLGALKEQFQPLPNVYDSSTSFYEECTNNITQDVVPIEEIEIDHLDDTDIYISHSAEHQNCSEMVHSVSELRTTDDPVPLEDTPGPSKMISQKEKKSASKRKLSDLYEDISSLTATKKNKIKQKEDYIKDQNKNKEDIIKTEKKK
ncbi:myb/SANT-like DNA-binding domain-containing protein 3 [Diabrotica undecimpunctata]|uniref:myb/SANT-like DNA-binding domain-containing protein 3 n=1 Tax=Diabrotica undecimpunctata TaxID=50387 RepID=UPI003B63EAE0